MLFLNLDSNSLPVAGVRVLLLATGGFCRLYPLDTVMPVSVSLTSPQSHGLSFGYALL